MSGFRVDDFMSKVDNLGGFARSWKFGVQIKHPATMGGSADTIEFLASAAQLPRKGFSTTEHRIYGINRTIPYEQTYEPTTIKFINTADFSPRNFWQRWLDYIQPRKTLNVQYYQTMIGEIKIYHLPEAGSTNIGDRDYDVTLLEAYPESMSDIELGWDQSEIMSFDVSIRYKEWTRGSRQGEHFHKLESSLS